MVTTEAGLGPSLEEILSRKGLKEINFNVECPREIRDDIAVELGADWEMIGRYLEFTLDELRDINRENTSQEMCRLSLLDAWHKREGQGATFMKLARAFHRRKRRDLVDLLCTKLKSTLTLVPLSGNVPSLEVPSGNDQQHRLLRQPLGSITRGGVSDTIETLDVQFRRLHGRLLKELTDGSVSVDNLLQALTLLPFSFSNQYEDTIQSMLSDLEKKEAVRTLFHRLNPLFTFIDYKLLQHLISEFGSMELKNDMTSYVEKVQLFKKLTTINDLIDHWPGLKVPQIDHKLLRARFEDDPKSYTLEKLDYFRNHFYNELRLSQFVSVSILMLLKSASSFIAVWYVPSVVINEIITAIGQMDRTFFQTEQIVELSLDERTLYQGSIPLSECMTSSVMGPLSACTHVKSPLQQDDANKDALYSLVVSIKSSPHVYEVYIDAYLHYTALKILKLRRKQKVHGKDLDQYGIKSFRFDSETTSEPSLRLIVPEKNPYIIAVEPEDGMVTHHNGYT